MSHVRLSIAALAPSCARSLSQTGTRAHSLRLHSTTAAPTAAVPIAVCKRARVALSWACLELARVPLRT